MTEPEFRRLRVEDIPALEAFVSATYGVGARFKLEPRIRWQYVDNPFRPASETGPTVWGAVVDGRIVGAFGVQDACARVDGEDIPIGWSVDLMIDPAFRRQGLGARIYALALDERTALATVTAATVGSRRMFENEGSMTLDPTREFVRPISISPSTIRRFLTRTAENGGSRRRQVIQLFNASWIGPVLVAIALRMAAFVKRPTRSRERFVVEEVDRFPDTLDDFWERTRDRYDALFERSTKFLNWRFCDAPDLQYRRFLLRSGTELRGYVVTRVASDAELPVGLVVDMFADPDDEAALDALLATAADALAPRCEFLEGAATTASYRSAFERNGYVATKTTLPTIVCRDRDLDLRLRAHLENWHFTKGDHDWDQIHPV